MGKHILLRKDTIPLLNQTKSILYGKFTEKKKITDDDTIKEVLKYYLNNFYSKKSKKVK